MEFQTLDEKQAIIARHVDHVVLTTYMGKTSSVAKNRAVIPTQPQAANKAELERRCG